MGHGVPSALATAVAYAAFTTLSDLVATDPQAFELSPANILERVNRIIFEAVKGKISMTCFLATFDFEAGKLSFANAGHNFPFIMSKGSDGEKSKIPMLRLQGDPLGLIPTQKYAEKSIDLKAGDKIFLYTDGLFECKSVNKIEFGKKNFLKAISESATSTSIQTIAKLQSTVDNFFQGTQLADDVTVVIAEVDARWDSGEKKTSLKNKPSQETIKPKRNTLEDAKSTFSFDVVEPKKKIS